MKRREFIMLLGGGAAVPVFSPIRVEAQQTDQPRRVGVLISFSESDPESKERIAAFRHGLQKRGWTEGGNIHVDYRFASGEPERFSTLAKELIASRAEVIVAHTPLSQRLTPREPHGSDCVCQCL
jgi:putative ABC transport system substrate-binding protein